MSEKLKVLVCGTGFAGQGHTEAFRYAGAEVVGMVGRTVSVVKEVSEKMGIPYQGTDWQQALIDCQPDIVSIGTPGGAHCRAYQASHCTRLPCVLRQATDRKWCDGKRALRTGSRKRCQDCLCCQLSDICRTSYMRSNWSPKGP